MYKNVGETLKALAIVIEVIGIIVAIIGGGVLMSEGQGGLGVAVMFSGAVISILTPIILYAFGEIVENTAKTVKSLEFIEKSVRKLEYTVVEISEKPNDSNCRFTKMYCPNCGTETQMPENKTFVICEVCGKVINNKS